MRDAALAARGQAPRGARGPAPQAPQAPPFTLLFFHLEKCGGTSVASWLGSLKRQRYINAFIPFQHASRWAAQFPTVLNLSSWPVARWRSENSSRTQGLPDWRTSGIAVEFHSLNKRYFVSVVAPALPALRRAYAAHNVTLITATVVREPVAHLLSTYHMWPPCRCGATPKQRGVPFKRCEVLVDGERCHDVRLVEFPEFAVFSAGLQGRALLTGDFNHADGARPSERDCTNNASAPLVPFDAVGTTDALGDFFADVARRMRLPPTAANHSKLKKPAASWKLHPSAGAEISRGAAMWTEQTLNASVRAQLALATRCDALLYRAARARPAFPTSPTVASLARTGSTASLGGDRTSTGRRVVLRLRRSEQQVLHDVNERLERRTRAEQPKHLDALLADRQKHARQQVERLYRNSINGELHLLEYVEPRGRLGYQMADGSKELKALFKEVRHAVLRGWHELDLRRCHIRLTVGAHEMAVAAGKAPPNPLLRRAHADWNAMEEELAQGQAGGRLPVKTLLSKALNLAPDDRQYDHWPLARDFVAAVRVARRVAANTHPAVLSDPLHPGSEVDTDLKGNEAFAARILERRCLQAIFEVEPDAGYALNDAVFLPAAPKDLQAIHSALQALLGFDMELKVVAVE